MEKNMSANQSHVTTDEINEILSRREDLTEQQTKYAMEEILHGRMDDEQLASFITLLHAKGETADELATLVRTMWDNSPSLSDLDIEVDISGALDTCGTGGDMSGTFNISTAAALVLAAAGIPIAKHGNRAASSRCGGADVLEALGIPVGLSPLATAQLFTQTGFTFLFAPTFHPGMRFAAPVRKALGVPTTFNFLGPLANPYHVPFRLHGVSQPTILETYIKTLAELGVERAYVFHGLGGLDEISLSGVTHGYRLLNEEIVAKSVDPQELGFASASLEELKGGDAQQNAEMITSIFSGTSGPTRDIVVLNAAVGYDLVRGVGLPVAITHIADFIDSGMVSRKVAEISQVAQALAMSMQR